MDGDAGALVIGEERLGSLLDEEARVRVGESPVDGGQEAAGRRELLDVHKRVRRERGDDGVRLRARVVAPARLHVEGIAPACAVPRRQGAPLEALGKRDREAGEPALGLQAREAGVGGDEESQGLRVLLRGHPEHAARVEGENLEPLNRRLAEDWYARNRPDSGRGEGVVRIPADEVA